MSDISILHWSFAFFASFLLGISKSGIKGIAILIVTIMAFVFGSKASTGIIMPLLVVGDIFAITYYRRHVQWKHLFRLLPWMVIGVLLGVFVGKDIPESSFKKGMAGIILISAILMLWFDLRKSKTIPKSVSFGASMGLAAGFTTMIGNLAGAFSNLYFLAMRLPKNNFIGTAAWLFFFINLFKLPFHIFYWNTISLETFKINLILIPVELLGLFLGVRIVRSINEKYYRKIILLLTAIGAIILFLR